MPRLSFNQILDKYLTTGEMSAEDYYKLDDEQKIIIQTIKRAYKRINKTDEVKVYENN